MDSRFYRVLLKLLGMHAATGCQGYSFLMAQLHLGFAFRVLGYGKALFILVSTYLVCPAMPSCRRLASPRTSKGGGQEKQHLCTYLACKPVGASSSAVLSPVGITDTR